MNHAASTHDVKVDYLPEAGLEDPKFVSLSEKFYGKGQYASRKARLEHFSAFLDFRCCVAIVDGDYVGQSCAYKTYAIAEGKRREFWWAVDTFVLSECRGKGIGKKLQEKLHQDIPNFSTAWYSPINGIIKRKYGADDIFGYRLMYYPVSCLFSMALDACWRKIFKRPFPVRLSLPSFYSRLNSLMSLKRLRRCEVEEHRVQDMAEHDFAFIAESMKGYDFYIERSPEFLRWRYTAMPYGIHLYRIKQEGKQVAFAACSDPHPSGFCGAPVQVVTIYELLIAPDVSLNRKDVMFLLSEQFRKQGKHVDGIYSSLDTSYMGRVCYPVSPRLVLSTLRGKFKNPYFTFADQDLDQI